MHAPEHMVAKFLQTVKEMRDGQKEYFRTRDKYVLRQCKVDERKVDEQVQLLAVYYRGADIKATRLADSILPSDTDSQPVQMPLL